MPSNAQLDPLLTELFERSPLPPLEPGKTVYSTSLQTRIKSLQTASVVKAALNLANDDIKGCHDIVEQMQGESTADCLHAILHRREGDYWNSNWWWSRIQHPLFPSTRQCKTFVNACEKSTPGSDEDQDLREQQWAEMKRVVRWVVDNKA